MGRHLQLRPRRRRRHIGRWVDSAGRPDGFTRTDFEAHVRDEFSTYTWVIEGLLDRAGFDVVDRALPRPTHAEYVCRRRA